MEDDRADKSKSGVIGVRLSAEELDRFQVLVERAKRRNTLSDRAAVARELMGFPAVPRTITEEDRQFLTGTEQVEVVPPGRLTRQQESLIQKVKEIFLSDPDSDLSSAISASINALWVALRSRDTRSPKKKTEKMKSKNKPKSSNPHVNSDGLEEGGSPPPG